MIFSCGSGRKKKRSDVPREAREREVHNLFLGKERESHYDFWTLKYFDRVSQVRLYIAYRAVENASCYFGLTKNVSRIVFR